jgi:hypothetical protein
MHHCNRKHQQRHVIFGEMAKSYQPSAISYQLSAISPKTTADRYSL